ncbi:MAG: LysR family transcriptional regulator, partial [Neisseriaceae bacterium]|nr:LysR family transcriptional regulator [Neisseriaceae bacterium]
MNLVFIETFVTVALSKNITDSAAKLFTSQSTVSYRLKEL